jgi:hypothetical protein
MDWRDIVIPGEAIDWSDIAVLIVAPVMWIAGHYGYGPERRARPKTLFWLRLTFVMAVVAVGATILEQVLDNFDLVLNTVAIAALGVELFWFWVASARTK